MARSFDLSNLRKQFTGGVPMKDPRVVVRAVLGVLLLANIVAALFVLKPWGGSAEDLARQLQDLQGQLRQRQSRLARTRALVEKVQQGKTAGDEFMTGYILDRRTVFSTLLGELDKMAAEAGMQPREKAFAAEPVEGSENLSQLTITANYEGNYDNLRKFVHLLDKSPRLLIVESMQAAPQSSGALNASFKLDTFIRDASAGGVS